MPIKSKAQRRKFAQLLMEGKISAETFEEWNRAAGTARLPERLHPKKSAKGKRKSAKGKRKSTMKSATKQKTARARRTGPRAQKRRR